MFYSVGEKFLEYTVINIRISLNHEFNYSYHEYENGVWGKCVEMPAISAQVKTRDKVCMSLREMTSEYLELSKEIKMRNNYFN